MTSAVAGLGALAPAVETALERITREQWARRMWEKDGTLWSSDPARANEIAGWMGWLNVAQDMSERREVFSKAREQGARGNFRHAVVAGMGGSSLCPDVLRRTFGAQDGAPELLVLDSTDPSTIADIEAGLDLERSMFIISSKSGGTTETLSHYRYLHQRLRDAGVPQDGLRFVAITDDGSSLQRIAADNGFAAVFLNPADIGGRYSALSYFGLIPATVMGLDVDSILSRAVEMAGKCHRQDAAQNPGLLLGAVLGVAAAEGRDKCTIVCSPLLSSFGMWLEQLLAESTGKQGRGVIPIEGEPLGAPDVYGDDRLFVHLRTPSGSDEQDQMLDALSRAGHPVFTVDVPGREGIFDEFLCWEFATAAAGAILGINPFDQPNVQESKDNTAAALERFRENGDFGVDTGSGEVAEAEALLESLSAGDYFAILAYTEPSDDVQGLLDRLRVAVRERHHVATTSGYGPRYLHSTGQLHKGGPNSGVYLLLSDDRGEEIPIPGQAYGFKTLIRAQWAGDLKSLRDHGRRAAHVSLGTDRAAVLERLLEVAQRAPVTQ